MLKKAQLYELKSSPLSVSPSSTQEEEADQLYRQPIAVELPFSPTHSCAASNVGARNFGATPLSAHIQLNALADSAKIKQTSNNKNGIQSLGIWKESLAGPAP